MVLHVKKSLREEKRDFNTLKNIWKQGPQSQWAVGNGQLAWRILGSMMGLLKGIHLTREKEFLDGERGSF